MGIIRTLRSLHRFILMKGQPSIAIFQVCTPGPLGHGYTIQNVNIEPERSFNIAHCKRDMVDSGDHGFPSHTAHFTDDIEMLLVNGLHGKPLAALDYAHIL